MLLSTFALPCFQNMLSHLILATTLLESCNGSPNASTESSCSSMPISLTSLMNSAEASKPFTAMRTKCALFSTKLIRLIITN